MKNTSIILLLMMFTFTLNAQTFTWSTASDNGATVSETVDGVTVTVSNTFPQGGQEIDLLDAGGYAGSTGNLVMANVTNIGSITFTFTQAIDIHDIYALNAGGDVSSTWTYTPTGGSNSVVNDNISGLASGHTVILNWSGVSSFTVTKPDDLSGLAFDIINDPTLPVELTSFKANFTGNDVELNWQTATEVNNYGFAVERRPETGDWKEVGFVEGAGNSNTAKEYSFEDLNLNLNPNLTLVYRLKQIDLDGKFTYSKEVEVKLENVPSEFALEQNYPNPFNPTTTIKYSISAVGERSIVPVQLRIYNLLGEEVATLVNKQQVAGKYEVKFDASNFASGVYMYKLTAGDFVSVKRFVLMK